MAKLVRVGNVAQIPPGEGRVFDAGGTEIAVFRSRNGEIFASQAHCPHKNGPLADGLVGPDAVICPLHEWRFDLRSGETTSGPCGIRVYPIAQNEQGLLTVELPD